MQRKKNQEKKKAEQMIALKNYSRIYNKCIGPKNIEDLLIFILLFIDLLLFILLP